MKLYELKLLLPYEQEPLLRASIRELSRRARLNYRTAHETTARFFESGIMGYERHGCVKVCSLELGSEQAIAALTEASLARWLLALGTGPLVAEAGRNGEHPLNQSLALIARRLADETGALCLLARWEPPKSDCQNSDHPVLVCPDRDFTLVAVTSPGAREQVKRSIECIFRELDGKHPYEVLDSETLPKSLMPSLTGRALGCPGNGKGKRSRWLVLMGHERFWRIMGVGLS